MDGRIVLFLFSLGGACTAWGQMFVDVTATAKLNAPYVSMGPSGGTAVADFNRDGWPDVFTTGDQASNSLFLNQTDGSFGLSPINDQIALAGAGCGSTAAADYDNDGWPDIYIACAARNYLFRNVSGQQFVDVSDDLAVNHGANTQAVAWGDMDADGRLDLVLGVHEPNSGPPPPDSETWDQLMMNDGPGQFSNLSYIFDPQQSVKKALALILTDIDRDQDIDIYIANDKEDGNTLWRNDGAGCDAWCFSDISMASGAERPADSMGVTVGDYDRDGDWDIYYSGSDEQILLQNQQSQSTSEGALSFIERSVEAGVNITTTGWGVIFFDADHDGWEDLFLAGSGTTKPDHLLHNQQDGTFSDHSAGLTQSLWTYSAARLDYDRDGRLDLVLGHPGDGYRLYRNVTDNDHHWLILDLEGGNTVNRDGIGAWVRLTMPDGSRQMRELRAGSSRGSSHQPIIHFGLGIYDRAVVTIRWPDGTLHNVGELVADRYHQVVFPPADVISHIGFESP